MKDQLLNTWHINNRMNLLLIDNITDTGMTKTLSTRSGRNVYQQLAHVHDVRINWMEISAKDISKKYSALGKDTEFNRKLLRKAFEDAAKGIEELLDRGWEDGGKVKSFKTGVIPMLGYFISHESHHRGNIILTLKQSGERIPDTIKWGLWEWGK
jgi:uncharacterized damage-inducible protein DinB